MDNLDLNLIPVLDAIVRHRHLGQAASELGMSQPGISYALKRLRLHFGDPLFIRTRAGMQPTETVERIAPVLATILEAAREHLTAAAAFDPLTSLRTFSLLTSDLGELIVLPKLLRALSTLAPRVNIKVQSPASRDLVTALQSGQVDLMIGYFPELGGADLFQQRLYSHGFACLARKGHPKIKGVVTRETFLGLQHASIRSTGRSQQTLERHFEKQGIRGRTTLETPNILSAPFVVAATDVVVTVPAAVGELFSLLAGVQVFDPPVPLPAITVCQYWHRRQHNSPANKWLRDLVYALFAGKNGWRMSQ